MVEMFHTVTLICFAIAAWMLIRWSLLAVAKLIHDFIRIVKHGVEPE